MKKKTFPALLVVVITLLIVVARPTAAGPPTSGGGEWIFNPPSVAIDKVANCNIFFEFDNTGTFTGLLDGEANVDATVVLYCNTLRQHFNSTVTFEEVTVGGQTGGLEMKANGSKVGFDGDWKGHWVIIDAWGDLEGLHGQGSWWGPTSDVQYDGKVHFEPSN